VTPAPLSDVLREARTAVGLTQQEAAGRIGVSTGTVARWEQGRITPSGRHLQAAAEVYEADFGLTVDPASVRELQERVAALERQVQDLTRLVKRRPR
jgi:transcriptional regulator with XRE-family HTH domain